MFPCLFQLVPRFLQCLEWPKAHTQLMAKNLVTALKLNTDVSLSFQPMHATAFSRSRCSSTIMSVWLVMLCFCVPTVPVFQIPRLSPMVLSRQSSVADVWVLLGHQVYGRVQPSTDGTFHSRPALQPHYVLFSLSPSPVKRGNMGGVLQSKHTTSRLEPQCLMLALAAA